MRILVAIVCALAATSAAAESLFDSLARSTGLMATPADPPDFVKSTRPTGELAAIPVFSLPEEPRSTIKTPAQLKAMDADLERASATHHAPGASKAGGAKAQHKSP